MQPAADRAASFAPCAAARRARGPARLATSHQGVACTPPARVREIAGRFARAYLRWQLGHDDLRTRRALRTASTRGLWAAVARRRARPVAHPGPPAHVGSILVTGRRAAVLLAGPGHRLLITLTLGRDRRRVRVTAISR